VLADECCLLLELWQWRKQPPSQISDQGPTFLVIWLGLYTILLLPIVYGVWLTKGGPRRCAILPNSRAIVLQQCGQCRWAEEIVRCLIRAQKPRRKRISCKGQHSAQLSSSACTCLRMNAASCWSSGRCGSPARCPASERMGARMARSPRMSASRCA